MITFCIVTVAVLCINIIFNIPHNYFYFKNKISNCFENSGIDVTWYQTAGDGNCLYGSISNELLNNDKYKRGIRYLTVKYGQDNLEYFNNNILVPGDDNEFVLSDYISAQYRNGVDGEAYSIQWASLLFDVNIYCWSWAYHAKKLVCYGFAPKPKTTREIHIVHCGLVGSSSQHYYSIRFNSKWESDFAKILFLVNTAECERPPQSNTISNWNNIFTSYSPDNDEFIYKKGKLN